MARRPDLPHRVLALARKAAPFAYCDACLALRVDAGLAETTAALATLAADGVIVRTRRVCYGCGRMLEIAVLREAPPAR